MRNVGLSVLSIFLLIAPFDFATAQTSDEVTALVMQTTEGIERNALQTIARINRAEHPYVNKDNAAIYVFVFDTDLTLNAHPFKIGLVGENMRGKPDVNGKMFRDEFLEVAQTEGSGWIDYHWENPKTKKIAHKNTFVNLARGSDGKDYIVGSGKYFDD